MIHALTGLLMMLTPPTAQNAATPCDSTVQVPNAFSPNGDGVNDCFQPHFAARKPVKFKLKIFNRWGEMLVETDDWQFCWDTTITRKKQKEFVPMGVYYWTMEYEYEGAEKHSCVGNVSIIR